MRFSSTRFRIIFCLSTLSMAAPHVVAAPTFTKYRNDRWGFCLTYPSDWSSYEGVDRAGVLLNHKTATISIGALPDPESPSEPKRPMSLEENADSDLVDLGIGKLSPPTDIKIGPKTRTVLAGMKALKTEATYVQKGLVLSEETFYVIYDGAVYKFQLKCALTDRQVYQPMFRKTMSSFHWKCG